MNRRSTSIAAGAALALGVGLGCASMAGALVRVYLGGRLLLQRRARSLRQVTIPGLPGTVKRTIVIDSYTRRGLARRTRATVSGRGALSRTTTVRLHSPRHRKGRHRA